MTAEPEGCWRECEGVEPTCPSGYTDAAEIIPNYRTQAMPTTVFITADGHVFRKWTVYDETATANVREMLEEE